MIFYENWTSGLLVCLSWLVVYTSFQVQSAFLMTIFLSTKSHSDINDHSQKLCSAAFNFEVEVDLVVTIYWLFSKYTLKGPRAIKNQHDSNWQLVKFIISKRTTVLNLRPCLQNINFNQSIFMNAHKNKKHPNKLLFVVKSFFLVQRKLFASILHVENLL